jgi:hypothetical protein
MRFSSHFCLKNRMDIALPVLYAYCVKQFSNVANIQDLHFARAHTMRLTAFSKAMP